MNTKDKAVELFLKSGTVEIWADKHSTVYEQKLRAKLSATNVVDEIIRELTEHFINSSIERIKYYTQVREEIKKIK
jgi:hypothetical protein